MFEEIMNSLLSNIFDVVATTISLVVAYHVIPYVKNDLIPWLKEKHLYGIVKSYVQAAEKMAESGVINKDDKKKYVVDLLKSKGIVVNEMVDAFIESCVKELDMIVSAIYEEVAEIDIDVEDNDSN